MQLKAIKGARDFATYEGAEKAANAYFNAWEPLCAHPRDFYWIVVPSFKQDRWTIIAFITPRSPGGLAGNVAHHGWQIVN